MLSQPTLTLASYGLLSIIMPGLLLDLMVLGAPSSTESASNELDLFELPVRIDDPEELMEQYGHFMLGNMNRSVEPCENFYDFACGNWKESTAVPKSARNDSFLHTIQLKINTLMVNFLKNATEADLKRENTTAEVKAKQFYFTCVAMKNDTARGYRQLMEQTDDRFEDQRKNEECDWIYINFMSHYEMYPLLPLKVHYNTDMRKFVILLTPPTIVLGNKESVNVKNLTRDFKIENEERRERFEAEFQTLVDFEKNLTSRATKRNVTEFLYLGDFLKKHAADKLNWTRYFDVAFNGTYNNKSWHVINTIESVDSLVRYLKRTDLHTLRTYVKWRVVLNFYYTWKAKAADNTTESICREHTEQYFNYALLPYFIDNVFDSEQRADILQSAKHIKDTFYGLIDRYTWLDDETKSQAKTKLSSMDVIVGYNDDMTHRTMINEIYANLNMTSDWFKNLELLEKNRARIRMRSVGMALIPSLMSTRSVNAYYADFLNLVHITVGIAQWPQYHIKFPASLKYGGIGSILGHEMAHGFDSHAYQYNYDGKKQNWWSEASLRNFRERYRCLEAQYNKYIYLGTQTNGNYTSTENIADNVGTRIAYYAYMSNEGREIGERFPLRGIHYTNKQLFFIKFAQTWCSGKDTISKLKSVKTDVHAYDEFRVLGTLSNMPEFSEAFKCKLGTDMNPMKKCVVW